MTTYTLSISTAGLGLGVIDGGRIVIERKRSIAADQYPPINVLYSITAYTDTGGLATASLKADDTSTYHIARLYDAAGAVVYQVTFRMKPEDCALAGLSEAVIGASNIQFKDEGVSKGTPGTVRNLDFVGGGVSLVFAGETLTVTISSPDCKEASTFSAVSATGSDKFFVVVASDETNGGFRTTYFYDGVALNWVPLVGA